jgi:hypothetical protein
MIPEDAESERALAGRSDDRFELVPSSPDLLCLVRTPPGGAHIQPPRLALAGDAAAFPLSDLIAFVSQSRWSGVLRVRTPGGERSMSLKDGEVRGASSDDPTDRLGEIIVRLGYVQRRQLDQVLEHTPPSKVGRALVDQGWLQPHDLWKCITFQLSEIFHTIVLCREGVFMLVDQELDEGSIHSVQLSTQSLLMDSIRKIDEMAHFRKRIPHGRVYVARKRPSDGKLEEEEDHVLALADGQRTVWELGHAAKLSEFDVTKIIFRLLEGGYAAIGDRAFARVGAEPLATPAPAALTRPPADLEGARAVIRIFDFIFREIRDEVAKKNMEGEFIGAANAALARRALSPSPVLANLSFDKAGNLSENQLLRQYEESLPHLGSEPVASLKQALSDVMFFLLFQAGELLESRADEDLARRVKELLATIEAEF